MSFLAGLFLGIIICFFFCMYGLDKLDEKRTRAHMMYHDGKIYVIHPVESDSIADSI